jgi:hypothetical protein
MEEHEDDPMSHTGYFIKPTSYPHERQVHLSYFFFNKEDMGIVALPGKI